MEDFVMDLVMPGVMVLFALGLLGGLGYAATDAVQSIRARPAKYECLARNLEPVRLDLSSRVVCRSRNTGADTLNVNQVAK